MSTPLTGLVFSLRLPCSSNADSIASDQVGRLWLSSSKIARKAGQWQTAYSALLQAQQSKAPYSFIESAKYVKAIGEPLRALQELENSMKLMGILDDNMYDLTVDQSELKAIKAKVHSRSGPLHKAELTPS